MNYDGPLTKDAIIRALIAWAREGSKMHDQSLVCSRFTLRIKKEN